MGGSWKQIYRERDANKREAAERARIDEVAPPIERPCGTPGAVYSISVEGRDLKCDIRLPFNIAAATPREAHDDMKRALHDAILPIIEKFYRDVWDQTIAGKRLGNDPGKMPAHWELLFTKWLKRCFERGEWPMIEGRQRHSQFDLPTKYKWW